MFKVRHDCIGRVLFSLKIYNTATTILTIDRSRERERVSERERDVNEEKRGIFPGKRQTIDFCGFFSPHSVPSQKRKEETHDQYKKKRRTRKLRPHLVHHAEEEEDVEEDAAEEETLVATRLAKCLSMVSFFLGKFLIREKLCVLSFRVFYLFFTALCFFVLGELFPLVPLHKFFVLVKKVRAVLLCVF